MTIFGEAGVMHEKSYMMRVMTDRSETDTIGGTPRAVQRPAHVKAPAEWTASPVPRPEPICEEKAEDQPGGRNPVRYGDWELKGIAVDF
jgi:hypothetical protein